MNKLRLFIAILALVLSETGVCRAASTDQWIGKAANATGALARGDVKTAAEQAVGTTNIPLARQTNVSAGPGSVWLRQGIPAGELRNPYLNTAATYNVGTTLGRSPNLSQNVQVSENNRYFSNTTTFSGNFDRK